MEPFCEFAAQDFSAHRDDVSVSSFSDCGVVVFDFFDLSDQLSGDRLAVAAHSPEGVVVLDRHYPRNDGAFYSDFPAVLDKSDKDVWVVKELGDDQVCSGVYFIF